MKQLCLLLGACTLLLLSAKTQTGIYWIEIKLADVGTFWKKFIVK